MPTECNPEAMLFAPVERRRVEASFDGGAMTSDAGALLLGATDRAIGLVDRFASCFADARAPGLIEHEVATLVRQRVVGIALGYEDLNDHDELRHDPVMAVLAGKLTARRQDCAPVAGKMTYAAADLLTAKNVPFIFVTGYGAESLKDRFAEVPVLQKPFNLEVLQNAFVVTPASKRLGGNVEDLSELRRTVRSRGGVGTV